MKSNDEQQVKVFDFDDSYRPVKISRHVYSFKRNNDNDFSFDSSLNFKLYDLLCKHMEGKPALIFCPTRKSVLKAAEVIIENYKTMTSRRQNLPWHKPR